MKTRPTQTRLISHMYKLYMKFPLLLRLVTLALALGISSALSAAELQGTISLPSSQVATSGEIGASVRLCAYSVDIIQNYCVTENVAIVEGSGGTEYTLAYNDSPQDEFYEISFSCLTNCSSYITQTLYLNEDLSTTFAYSSVVPDTLLEAINFSLLESRPLTGTINLPEPNTAGRAITAMVSVCAYNFEYYSIGCSEASFTIPDGADSAPYDLSIIPIDGYYSVSTECIENCAPYLNSKIYLQSDLVTTSFYRGAIRSDLIPEQIELTLVEGKLLVGTISLPAGDVAANDITSEIRFCSSDSGATRCFIASATITAGNSSVDYDTAALTAPINESYTVSIQCIVGCGQYARDSQYLQSDLSTAYDIQTVDDDLLPERFDVTLQQGRVLSGSIVLPNSEVAAGDISTVINICSYDANGTNLSCHYSNVPVLSGDNSAAYSLTVRPAPVDGFYRVYAKCEYDCGLYLRDTRYLQADLSFDYAEADVSPSIFPNSIDFALEKGTIVSGVVSLPNGALATDDISNSFQLCSYGEGGSYLGCRSSSYGEFTIAAGTNSTPYAISVRTATIDGFYRFSSSCSGNCGPYLRENRYLQSDLSLGFDATNIAAPIFPSTIDFDLAEGRVVTGNISLPAGEFAEANIDNNVSICSFDSLGAYIGCGNQYSQSIIAVGSNSTTYAISVRPAPADGFYRLYTSCNSNCGLNLKSRQYVQADLSIGFTRNDIAASALPAVVDFTLTEGRVVTGSVSLPDSEIAEQPIYNQVQLCTYGADDNQIGCNLSYLVIDDGSSSASYAMSIIPAPSDGSYRLYARCSSNCGLLLSDDWYLQPDLSYDFEPANLTESELPSSIDFVLNKGQTLNGTVVLPNSESAESDIITTVRLCSYDSNEILIACSPDTDNAKIDSGSNSGVYALSVRPAPIDGYYQLLNACSSGCGLYIYNAQYLRADLSFGFSQSNLSASLLPGNVDFTLSKGQLLSGTISLPNGAIAQNDIRNIVQICTHVQDGYSIDCRATYPVIPAGAAAASFVVSILAAPTNGGYQVTSICSSGCGLYLRDTQYLQADMSLGFEPATIDPEALPSMVDFVLPRGQELTGSVELLGGALAANDIRNTIDFCSYGADQQYIDCEYIEVVIPKDSNSASYSVSIRTAPEGGSYRLSNYCHSNCGLYLTDTQYLQTDLTKGFEPALVPSSTLPGTVDFILDQGRVLNVSLSLPIDEPAADTIYNNFQICSYDDLGNNIDCSSEYSDANISLGDTNASFSISLRPAPPSGFYRVNTRCSSNCGLYITDQQYLQPDLSIGFEATFLAANALPNSVVFPLVKGKVFTFNLSLPNAEVAPADISNYIRLCSYDGDGGNADCSNSYDSATILNGENSATYALAVRPAPDNGSYEVTTYCRSNCGLYLDNRQYLQADLTVGYQVARVPALVFPTASNFVLPSGKQISGTISLPNNAVASSAIRGSVDICSYDAIGRGLDCNGINYIISSGSSSFQYELSVNAAPSDGAYRVSSNCDFSCDPYIDDTQYLQNDLNVGFDLSNVDADKLPETVDFELNEGQMLSGIISLPDSQLAASSISNRVDICVYDADDRYLDCQSKSFSIVSDTSSVEYQLSIRPAPIGGYYRVSSQCNSNCEQYLDVAQHVQADLSLGFERANISADNFPESVDIELTAGLEFVGNILLPNSEVALDNIDNRIFLCSYAQNSQPLDCSNVSVNIAQGSSMQGYLVSVRPAPSDGYYRLFTSCQSNCGLYLNTTRYLQADLSIGFVDSNVPTASFPETVDFVLTKGVVVSGNISLPDDEVASSDIQNTVSLCAYDENNNYLGCENISAEIANGESGGDYALSIRAAPQGGFYTLYTFCSTNCGLYLNETQYLQENLSIGFSEAQVGGALIPETVDFVLAKGRRISGKISLPNAELADDGIYNNVRFCSYDENDSLLRCESTSVNIPAGTNSASYQISNTPAPSGGYYQISARCYSNCDLFLSESQYLQADLSYRFFANTAPELPKVADIDLPDEINFELDRGFIINASVSLPNANLANEVIDNSLEICSYAADNSFVSCVYQDARIVPGANKFDVTLSLLSAANDGYYRVSTKCISNCADYLPFTQYLTADLSVASNVEFIPALELPSMINFTLVEGKSLKGNIKLVGFLTADASIFNIVSLCSYDAGGIELSCRQAYTDISTGELSSNYKIDPIRQAPDTGFYRVFTRCTSGCGLNLTTPQYLQADGSTGFDVADLQPSSLPDVVNFTLLTLVPDSYENDNDSDIASVVNGSITQNHNIHVPGDEDWIRINVTKQSGLSIFARSDVDEVGLALELFTSDLVQITMSEISDLVDSQNVSTIEALDLSAGSYYLKISSESLSDTVASYQLVVSQHADEEPETFCIPVKAENGNVALICL